MDRRTSAAALALAVALAAIGAAGLPRAARTPPRPVAPPLAADVSPPPPAPPPPAPPPLAPAPRPDRVRRALAAAAPPAGLLGSAVREAMLREGDSDPRLLRALGAAGLRPTALLPLALPLDPWLAAGLVDLERQVAAACPACAAPLDAPVAELVAAAPGVGCVVRGAVAADPEACGAASEAISGPRRTTAGPRTGGPDTPPPPARR
jgi:hypothetical protein